MKEGPLIGRYSIKSRKQVIIFVIFHYGGILQSISKGLSRLSVFLGDSVC